MPTITRKGCAEVGALKSGDPGTHSLTNEVGKKAGTISNIFPWIDIPKGTHTTCGQFFVSRGG